MSTSPGMESLSVSESKTILGAAGDACIIPLAGLEAREDPKWPSPGKSRRAGGSCGVGPCISQRLRMETASSVLEGIVS